MNLDWLTNTRIRSITILLALVYLVVGLLVLDDYGLSYDEEAQRYNNGLTNYHFVTGEDKEMLRTGNEKYHGPAFELLLIGAQNLLNVSEMRSIYLLRHLISFLTFFGSVVVMFLLAKAIFKEYRWALFCALMYGLSPRFFAEAFYNSKDIPFLALFTFSLYTLYMFATKRNFKWAMIHALVAGFMIDIRVMGIFVPIATVGIILYQHVLSFYRKEKTASILVLILFYLLVQAVAIIAFWPILWDGPWHHLNAAFREMSMYHWSGSLRYFGDLISYDQVPWHYLPTWMLITIPVPFLSLTAVGSVWITKKLVSFDSSVYSRFSFDHLLLSFLVVPIVLIIALDSVVYDGWRHVYFLYSPMTLIATRGAQVLLEKLKAAISKDLIVPLVAVSIAVVFIVPLISIVRYHPFQYVYFNSISRMIFNPIHEKFEMDYWGLSYKQGLDYILKSDTGRVKVWAENAPGYDNRLMFSYSNQQRLVYQDDFPDTGTYLLLDNRANMFVDSVFDRGELVEQMTTPSGPALSILKVVERQCQPHSVRKVFQDFEETDLATVLAKGSMNQVQRLSSDNPYGFSTRYVVDSLLLEGTPAVRYRGQMMSEESTPSFLSVLEVRRNGASIYWRKYWLGFVTYVPGRWETWRWSFTLKDVDLEVGDVISTYTWTVDGAVCYQNDMEVEFVKCID